MTPAARDRLTGLLGAWAPQRLLVVGEPVPEASAPETTRLAANGPGEAAGTLGDLGRFDVAVVSFHRPPAGEALETLLGRLKNLHAPRVVLSLEAGPADAARLRALAFEPDGQAPSLWVHDIDRYNRPREWNTPDDWAHPENFDKYRW